MNARGHDIHIRPAGEHGLVLVDGLQKEAIERMKHDGLAPAATVEASPGSYQAWIKVSDEALAPQVRRITAEALARHYEGQPARRRRRLALRPAGRLHEPGARTRPRRPAALRAGARVPRQGGREGAQAAGAHRAGAWTRQRRREERQRRLEGIRTAEPGHEADDPVQAYRKQAQRYLNQHGFKTDFARMDEAIAAEMAKSGRYTSSDIERGIREGSPNVESRRAGHMEEYAKRTAQKAWAAPEVQQKRQEQNREKDLQLQRGRNGPGLRR